LSARGERTTGVVLARREKNLKSLNPKLRKDNPKTMRLTEQVHLELRQTIQPGDTAIDATAGNGHDTLAMAEWVGPSGKVFAIDRQTAAITSTWVRLKEAGHAAQCELIEGDHATILNSLLPRHCESAAAITFNLGYLPGGEKAITTSSETTLRALEAAKLLLKHGGVLLVTAYRGHEGGMDEADQVESWMRALPEATWHIEAREPPTRHADRIPPILWIVRKLGAADR